MTAITLGVHLIEFSDCQEVGQGGPETCFMRINGNSVMKRSFLNSTRECRFHPTPLAFEESILAPLREATRFYLVRIDPVSMKIKKLSRGFAFMKLVRIVGSEVEFSTWWDDKEIHRVKVR